MKSDFSNNVYFGIGEPMNEKLMEETCSKLKRKVKETILVAFLG